jgi:hypothetical protein
MNCAIAIAVLILTVWLSWLLLKKRAVWRFFGILPPEIPHPDPRPPVLYLRAFEEDTSTDTTPLGMTYEGLLVSVLEEAGKVVAIGRPREAQAPWFGATRIYVGDRDWKDEVIALMKKAQIVVIQAHIVMPEKRTVTQSPRISEGLFWEFKTVVSQVRPEQLLLSLPFRIRSRAKFVGEHPDRVEAYEFFRTEVEALFPVSLPSTIGRGAFAIFDSAWQPTILYQPAEWKSFFGQIRGSRVAIRETLRPFFRRQGINLSYRPTIVKALLFFGIFFIFFFAPLVLTILFLVVASTSYTK